MVLVAVDSVKDGAVGMHRAGWRTAQEYYDSLASLVGPSHLVEPTERTYPTISPHSFAKRMGLKRNFDGIHSFGSRL